MKPLLTITCLLCMMCTLSAKAGVHFSPSIGYSAIGYRFDGQKLFNLTGASFKMRVMADVSRFQVGGGFDIITAGANANDAFLGTDEDFIEESINPHFLFNYKFAKWNKSYLYAGNILGFNVYTGTITEGTRSIIGFSAGWVFKLGGRVDIEISESYRAMIDINESKWYSSTTGQYYSGKSTLHVFTTDIGVRFHRK